MQHSWRRYLNRRLLLIPFAIVAAAVPALALAWAPYLPRLAFEGYPQPAWPASGSFAAVSGAERAPDEIPNALQGTKFTPRGQRLFEQGEGKALLIFQGGKLHMEHYADGITPDTKLNSYSMVKSLVGLLVLRAHADGRIESLDDPINRYVDDGGNQEWGSIPVIAFLRMRSGIDFEAGGPQGSSAYRGKDIKATRINPFGPLAQLHMLGLDTVARDLRTKNADRGRYNYQNINTAILGRLVSKVYGQPLEQVLSEKIWKPAGAAEAHWRRYGPGLDVSPYCCLYGTPRDWLQVGIFVLNNGTAREKLLPTNLWRQFLGLDLRYEDIRNGYYGLHLFRNVLDRAGEPLQGPFSYMLGRGGQVVYLMPEKDLIVVRFGGKVQLLHSTLYTSWRSIVHK